MVATRSRFVAAEPVGNFFNQDKGTSSADKPNKKIAQQPFALSAQAALMGTSSTFAKSAKNGKADRAPGARSTSADVGMAGLASASTAWSLSASFDAGPTSMSTEASVRSILG